MRAESVSLTVFPHATCNCVDLDLIFICSSSHEQIDVLCMYDVWPCDQTSYSIFWLNHTDTACHDLFWPFLACRVSEAFYQWRKWCENPFRPWDNYHGLQIPTWCHSGSWFKSNCRILHWQVDFFQNKPVLKTLADI